MALLLPWPNSKAEAPSLPGASVGLIDWILSEPVSHLTTHMLISDPTQPHISLFLLSKPFDPGGHQLGRETG